MPQPENTQVRQPLLRLLKFYDAVAIENSIAAGTPDLNCSLGWIECKYMKSFPKRDIPVKLKHPVSKHQEIWMWRRELAGGVALLCIRIEKEWFFFSGKQYKENNWNDNLTRDEMYFNAVMYYKGTPTETEICKDLLNYYKEKKDGNRH